MSHTPITPPALQPDQLKHMVAVLDELGSSALPAKAALVLGYFSALRQSNLLGQHALLTKDILRTKSTLTVHVRKSKTITSHIKQVTLIIPSIPNSTCCPVKTWRQYTRMVKPQQSGPALVLPKQGKLTVAAVTKLLRITLTGSSYPDPNKFTLHALRRGAVHGCVKAGASKAQIMDLGQWTSNSVSTYLPPKTVKTPFSTLTAHFG